MIIVSLTRNIFFNLKEDTKVKGFKIKIIVLKIIQLIFMSNNFAHLDKLISLKW